MAPETLTDYERRRQENIRRNAEMMETLKLQRASADLRALRPRRAHHHKKPPPSPSSSRRSLRIRGKSPERYIPKFTDLSDLTLTLTPTTSSSSSDLSTPNPNPLFDHRFDPRSSLVLKLENSAVVLTKIISSLRFLPFTDRTVVVAGNAVGDLGFWVVDSFNGAGLYACSPHSNLITGISAHYFSPARIFTSSCDRFVRLMDVEKENANVVICSSSADSFYSICQSPQDVSSLYVGEGAGKLKVWDEKAGKASSFWELHHGRINTIDFSPMNSHLMATSSSDGMACIWDLRSMKKDRPECINRVVHERAVNSAYFSPNGSCLATTSDDDRVGILSGVNFGDQSMIPHKNRGAKLVSSTRGIWGWNDSYLFLGNLERAIDVICVGNRTTMTLESPHMASTPQQLAAHPCKLGSLAAAIGGGKVFLWTKKHESRVITSVTVTKQLDIVQVSCILKSYLHKLVSVPCTPLKIKLIKILGLLGSGDKQASGHMYTVLGDIFRKCESSSNIGNAVLYECICCVSSIYPNTKMLAAAVEATSKFLKSDSHNLKYMGIDALGRLIKINPDIAEEHQLAVIDCLEDPDDTLKRKTFELLYKMTKSTNVEVIVDRMIDYMISINDNHYKTDIASRCVELAEQFAPSNQWFIQTMNKVFEHAGDLVNIKVAHNLMRLIAEGFGEDDEGVDSQLRSSAVDSYLHIIGEPKLPSVFLQVICWVLGEYGTADGKYSASNIIGKLCDVAEAHSSDDTVKAYAITAAMKIFAFEIAAGRKVEMLPECQSLIDELSASHSTDLQQRVYELQSLLGLDRGAIESVMPSDASCEDIEVDKDLSFLDSFVQQAIEKGARPYIPESERSGMPSVENFRGQYQQETSSHSLRFEAYELPKPAPVAKVPAASLSNPTTDLVPVLEPSYHRETHQAPKTLSTSDILSADVGVKLRLDGVQKKWGKPTYSSPSAASSSTFAPKKTGNGVSHIEVASSMDSRRHQQVEVPAEKQRLAASLFGASSFKTEKKPLSSVHKTGKGSHTRTAAPSSSEPPKEKPVAVVTSTPPPDLVDLGEPAPVALSASSVDPFMQLERLLGPNSASAPVPSAYSSAISGPRSPDLLSLYNDTPSNNRNSHGVANSTAVKKGPNPQDSSEKDATARLVGVTPTGNNPNLFRDLLG